MHSDDEHANEVPKPAHGMPDGPDDFVATKTIDTRSARIKGPRFANQGIYLIGGAGILLVVVMLSALGFFNGPQKEAGPIPDVPVAMATKQSADTNNLDSAFPKRPTTGGLSTPPPANGPNGTPGTPGPGGDALSRSLAENSNVSPPPTFAPSTAKPAQPPIQSNGGQPQYANVPPPQQTTVANVPNPGAVGQPAPQYHAPTGSDRASLFVGEHNEGNNTPTSVPTPDRVAGSEPVPPANGALYEPRMSGQGGQSGGSGGGQSGGSSGSGSGVANNIAYANSKSGAPAYLIQTRLKAVGKTEIWAGSVLAAQLDTGINTNLPGMATAHIKNDIYDSRTGQFLLIPKGTRIIGTYNASVDGGQNRVQTKWERLIWPDGSYLSLEGMAGGDREGNSGQFADVNDHRGAIFTTSIFTGLLAAGTQLVSGGGAGSYTAGGNGQVIYQSVGQQIAQQGNAAIQKKLSQAPELTVPRGVNFNIIIDRTIVLDPWKYGA